MRFYKKVNKRPRGLDTLLGHLLDTPHFTGRRVSGDHGVHDASPNRHEARQKRVLKYKYLPLMPKFWSVLLYD